MASADISLCVAPMVCDAANRQQHYSEQQQFISQNNDRITLCYNPYNRLMILQ